jgi:two-component system OmpR family response regulator
MSPSEAPGHRILVADDEEFLRDVVATALRFAGFEVQAVADGTEALAAVPTFAPALIVLDVMMPGPDGFEVCRRLRAAGTTTPVVFLTARGLTGDKLAGFQRGGDDYLTKPFNLDELVARVRAVLHRTAGLRDTVTKHRYLDLVLDDDTHLVVRAGQTLEMSPTEFRVLRYLLVNAGNVVSKTQILEHVWNYDFDGNSSIIENYISYLRKKVDATEPKLIHTIRGVGYTLRTATR